MLDLFLTTFLSVVLLSNQAFQIIAVLQLVDIQNPPDLICTGKQTSSA